MTRPFLRAGVLALAFGSLAACTQPDPLNTAGRRDGTPGNPTGTAASRAYDRAAGTDVSGAYPRQADGMPSNPTGTAASRAYDRAAGTDVSGAYPRQADGTRSNPRGTAVSRALGTTDR